MKKTSFGILVIIFLTTPASAGSMQATTYYPAPYGAYDRIQLVPRTQNLGLPCMIGTMYVSPAKTVQICQDPDGDGVGEWNALQSWMESVDASSNPILYPVNSDANLKVGIGTTAPEFKLSLDQDGGILAIGAHGSGVTYPASAEGAGTRLFWYPRKAVFRAGAVSGTQWDDVNIGEYSFAGNSDTTASGDYSTSLGLGTVAQAYASTAVGMYNEILGDPTAPQASDPVFQVGYGADSANRKTALAVLKNGQVGIGTTTVDPNYLVHIKGGGLIVEASTGAGESHVTMKDLTEFAYLGESADLMTGGRAGSLGIASDFIEMGGYTLAPTLYIDGAQQFVGIKEPNPSVELDVNGTIQATTYLYSSDENLKTEIQPISSALEKIRQINGIQFKWKENGKEDIGVTAQNIEQIFPELVQTNPVTGIKSVEYGNLIAPLIEALKEQQEEINALNEQIERLKTMGQKGL